MERYDDAKNYTQALINKLDRYIIRQFLGTYVFMLMLVMSISVVFDVSEKIDDFIERGAPLEVIIYDYYVNFILYYANLFSAMFIFLAVLLFTARMAKRSEIIPILSSGISFRRFLRPYFISALILTVFALWMNHYVIPPANKTRLEFEKSYTNSTYFIRDMYKEAEPGTLVFFRFYSDQQKFLSDFWVTKRNINTGEIEHILHAQQAFCDSLRNDWKLNQVVIREFNTDMAAHKFRTMPTFDTTLNFHITEFITKAEIVSCMPSGELSKYIQSERDKGSQQVPFYEIELHQRTSYPMATFVLTLIGVSLSSRKSRDGYGRPMVLGIVIILLYLFAMKMTTVAALNVGLDAFWAVWLPNIIFAAVAFLIYRRAPK